ncbi:PAN/Apple domain-containing protein [Aminobacter aminovorans]|uniref:PAN/Apple domain-containing protein n=1 Tax=Aminobacter aminovorans TaxID=83263 RepID=UPI0010466A5A|nr:PAN/Apple domain-containing protein [Aminobacter aminovorans]
MQVRHNTQLLEQAVNLLVKRSAIPTLEAQAAAQDRIARATGFRRLATGGAIAIAAIGIGIGVSLLWPAATPVATDFGAPSQAETAQAELPPADTPRPADPAQEIPIPTERPAPPEASAPPELPAPPEAPGEPDVATVNYTKFLNVDVPLLGETWKLTSGHYFKDEKDQSWDNAWCYTRKVVNGIDVNIDLAARLSPTARPQAPLSPAPTLASAGLDDAQAVALASHCPWLDEAKFASADFQPSFAKSREMEAVQEFVTRDGWDALGNDMLSVPIRNVSFDQCQARCKDDSKCLAVTYNKKYRACFLKSDASILVRSDEAMMAARKVLEPSITFSTLVFASDTVVVGQSYASAVADHTGCVLACAKEQACAGFNFDSKNRMCSLMSSAESSSPFRGVKSGLKASN